MDGSTSAWTASDYSKESIKLCVDKIKDEFGQQFSNSKSILEQHTHTMTIHESELPDGVVFVETKEDVQKVVKICSEYKCPIIPFGVGSSFEGHINAPYGGISIDMNNMNRIDVTFLRVNKTMKWFDNKIEGGEKKIDISDNDWLAYKVKLYNNNQSEKKETFILKSNFNYKNFENSLKFSQIYNFINLFYNSWTILIYNNISNIKILAGDYDVEISSKLITQFKHKGLGVTYWIALEKSSTYGA